MITRLLLSDRGSRWLFAILIAAAVLVPVCNLLVPAGSPLHIPTYTVTLLGKYLCYALLALSYCAPQS